MPVQPAGFRVGRQSNDRCVTQRTYHGFTPKPICIVPKIFENGRPCNELVCQRATLHDYGWHDEEYRTNAPASVVSAAGWTDALHNVLHHAVTTHGMEGERRGFLTAYS